MTAASGIIIRSALPSRALHGGTRLHRTLRAGVLALVLAAVAAPARADDVSVATRVGADSVTVGERFTVTWELVAPDSLRLVTPESFEMERTRALSVDWEKEGEGRYRGTMTAMTLDLDQASIPEVTFAFVTPGGDTVRADSPAVTVPVRAVAPDTVDMASLHPLKEPWEAPRSYTAWIIAAAAALVAAALLWWLWRRRKRRPVEETPEPVLPPDYVALTELTRIERLGLLEKGEFKEYYTRVVDVLRRFMEARFGIEAMDRTTAEVLQNAQPRGAVTSALEALLREADLVKFARFTPAVESGTAAMHAAREYISRMAPRHVPVEDGDEAKAQVG